MVITLFVEGGVAMFNSIKSLLLSLFIDMQTTFITLFAIGFLFCALMIWQGEEQNAPKFKKGLGFTVAGVVVFLLAKPIVEYVQSGL